MGHSCIVLEASSDVNLSRDTSFRNRVFSPCTSASSLPIGRKSSKVCLQSVNYSLCPAFRFSHTTWEGNSQANYNSEELPSCQNIFVLLPKTTSAPHCHQHFTKRNFFWTLSLFRGLLVLYFAVGCRNRAPDMNRNIFRFRKAEMRFVGSASVEHWNFSFRKNNALKPGRLPALLSFSVWDFVILFASPVTSMTRNLQF